MDIQALHRGLRPSDLPLEQLAANPSLSETDKVGEATRQFEAIMVRKLLSEVRPGRQGGPDGATSVSADIYWDMVFERLADSISQSGALGLGKALEESFAQQSQTKTPEPTPDKAAADRADRAEPSVAADTPYPVL